MAVAFSCSKKNPNDDLYSRKILCTQAILTMDAKLILEHDKREKDGFYDDYRFWEGRLSDSGEKCLMYVSYKKSNIWKDRLASVADHDNDDYVFYDLTSGIGGVNYKIMNLKEMNSFSFKEFHDSK